MKRLLWIWLVTAAAVAVNFDPAVAGNVNIPNKFQAGSPAVAAEVNANFDAVKNAVDENDKRIAALEAELVSLKAIVAAQTETIGAQQDRLAVLENSAVMALDDYVTVDKDSDDRGPLVRLIGINLQILNGLGSTASTNGLGNLIIGYDETYAGNQSCCADGAYESQKECEAAGSVWSNSHKTGSHYLVLGQENSYSQYGGIVAGDSNFAIGKFSTITGGEFNTASGERSSISGGTYNTASGELSAVSGGRMNTAGGAFSSVSGGFGNEAGHSYSSVSGGAHNSAVGQESSISGGVDNIANGHYSSVSGGLGHVVTGNYDWAAGTLWQDK